MKLRTTTSIVLVLFLGLGLAACGSGEADVTATLRDDAITLSDTSLAAGELTFEATNDGTLTHELEIFGVPEGVDADDLPIEGNVAAADEMLNLIDEVEDVAPGTSATLSVNLDPGPYAAICNLPGHSEAGMHTTFTVA